MQRQTTTRHATEGEAATGAARRSGPRRGYRGLVSDLVGVDDIVTAGDRIGRYVLRTPTLASPGLSAHLGVPVTLKLELLQRTGSFKVRGAFHKMVSLDEEQRAAGVAAVSGGNHGRAVAEAAGEFGVAATVVMPQAAPSAAVEACRTAGATVRLAPDMTTAFAWQDELVAGGATLVHPFDDPVLIAAQGTVGLELAEDAGVLTDVLVSIGGGGLISGVATALHALRPGIQVWGVETVGADAMARALAAGGPVPITPTSVVTSLCAPHVSATTFAHVSKLVEDVIVVSDADAVKGVRVLAERAKVWAEPAAGCLVPAAARLLPRLAPDTRLGLVVCGGNYPLPGS
jgi:threonine dehydratase